MSAVVVVAVVDWVVCDIRRNSYKQTTEQTNKNLKKQETVSIFSYDSICEIFIGFGFSLFAFHFGRSSFYRRGSPENVGYIALTIKTKLNQFLAQIRI